MFQDDVWPDLATPTPIAPPAGTPPSVVALCGITEDEWTRLLLDLLPRGVAWPREPGTTLMRFWSGVAVEPTRIQRRDCDLLAESYPCGAVELLPEWLATVGLPDACTLPSWPPPLAIQQAMICARLAARGGQSVAYFVALAASIGITISIVEHRAWRLGVDAIGCTPAVGACQYWWEVVAEGVEIFHATLCTWRMGEPICWSPDAALLECLIRASAPAHTVVTFRYPNPEPA